MTNKVRFRCFSVFLFLALSLCLVPNSSFAQRYHIQNYREQDGVASNRVNNAAQDTLGNLWFATRVGLTVFDGIHWQTISNRGPATPTGEGLVSIDGNGTVWWVNKRYPFAVSRLIDGKWEKLPNPPVHRKYTEIIDIKTWVNPRGESTLILAPYRGNLNLWKNGEWVIVSSGRKHLNIHSLTLDGASLLVAAAEGLLILDLNSPENLQPSEWELPDGEILGACIDPGQGEIWVISKMGLSFFADGELKYFFKFPGLFKNKNHPGLSVCLAPSGGIYFAEYSGVYHFHFKEGLELISPSNGLVTDGGSQVFLDRENIVWVCSTRGISKIISRRMACYNNEHGLLDGEVSSIIQRSSGEMVLGQRRGLTFFGKTIRNLSFGSAPLVFGRVTDMTEDSQGNLWIAANQQGLGLLGDDDSIRWYGEPEGMSQAAYALLAHDKYGLFVGTSDGLFLFDGEKFKNIKLPWNPTRPHVTIRCLIPLSTGGFAITTRRLGVFFWNEGTVTQIPGKMQDGSDNVFTVFEHPDGRLWVGTNSGLFRVEGREFVKTTAPEPEIDRPVFSIIQDKDGSFWFGTDDGVTIWDGESKSRFTSRDGLLGTETNRDALLCDSSGHIWIGTDSGLSVFRPEFDTAPTVAPVLHLQSIKIDGKTFPTDKPLRIEGPLASLVFIFNAPCFGCDDPIKFSARTTSLSSIETPRHVIHWPGILPMTNIPPGEFQVEIVGEASNGLITNTITTPLITITKPLQDRWYTKAFMGLAAAFVMWLGFAFFSGKRYARRLEMEVKSQTRELRESEETTRLESERLKSTLESISDGVVVIDGQCSVLLYNGAAEALFSLPVPPKLGCSLEEILPVNAMVDPLQAEQYQKLLNNPVGIRFDSEQIAVFSGKGKTSWLEVSAVPVTGSPGGVVFAFRDITNRLQTERNERRSQKLESLGLMAGGIAHDFNNLLTIMMGNLSLAQSTMVATATEIHQLEKVRQASRRAQKLTRQLLTFAKGGGPVLENWDLAPIIRDSVTFNLSGSNVECQLVLPDNLFWAKVDADQISQVIGNLVINARQAMSGGGQLSVSAMNVENLPGFKPGTRAVVILVEDNGVGISEADQARIFDPYFSTKERGTGLGLAIAHSIVMKHDGQLTVESAPGKGSRFRLVLPASEIKSLPGDKSVPEVVKTATAPLNILFMDDEEDIRLLLEKMLEKLGHSSSGAAHGEMAIDLYAKAEKSGQPYDLVILDLTISGGMGGLETLSELRKINLLVKVIVASGYSDAPVMAGYEKFGFSGILNKPFSLDNLAKAIGDLTENQEDITKADLSP